MAEILPIRRKTPYNQSINTTFHWYILQIWMRCETSGYTNDYRVYLGKHDAMSGPSLGERVVKHLCKPLKWKGHHVFFDR